MTSHPKDITKDLMFAIKDLKSVCEFVHFPIQSGSSKILKKMNRKYTKEQYLEKVYKLKEIVPNITLGTDIIVGFPGETEKDFMQTYNVLKEVKFSTAFIFAYSKRKNTPAAKLIDDVPLNIKEKRLQILLDLHDKILKEQSNKILNKNFEVLIERYNKDQKFFLKGRTRCFRKVIFKGDENMIGSLKQIKLKKFKHQTFIGSI